MSLEASARVRPAGRARTCRVHPRVPRVRSRFQTSFSDWTPDSPVRPPCAAGDRRSSGLRDPEQRSELASRHPASGESPQNPDPARASASPARSAPHTATRSRAAGGRRASQWPGWRSADARGARRHDCGTFDRRGGPVERIRMLTMEFAAAVQDSCRLLAGLGGTPEQNEHLLSRGRLEEAAAVDDLVQRYVTAEVSGIPIGRVATSSVVTPLGDLLSKSLARADHATKAAVRDAVVKAIARAYAATTGLDYSNEKKVSRQRTSRAIWNSGFRGSTRATCARQVACQSRRSTRCRTSGRPR
jgi:hypothetical protein